MESNTRGVWVQVQCQWVTIPNATSGRGRFSGGSWDHQPGQAVNLRYRFVNPPAAWGLHPYAGVQDWNVDDLLNLYVVNSSPEEITYQFGDYSGSIGAAFARSHTFDCKFDGAWDPQPEYSSNGCTYNGATYVLINTPVYNATDTDFIRKVLGHETGHVLGLPHPEDGGCCSVMRTGNPSAWNVSRSPSSWDLDSIDFLYT